MAANLTKGIVPFVRSRALHCETCDSCDSYFRGGNVEHIFIIIYIIYYIYNNIVDVGKNLIVTTVTDCLWCEKKFVTLHTHYK